MLIIFGMVSTKVLSIRTPHFDNPVSQTSMGVNSSRATACYPALLSQMWNTVAIDGSEDQHINTRGLDNYRVDSQAMEDFNIIPCILDCIYE